MREIKFMDMDHFLPHQGRKVILDSKFGIRHGVYKGWMGTFTLTDCNSPIQNANMSPHYVFRWAYEDEEDYTVYPPIPIRKLVSFEKTGLSWFERMKEYFGNF